MGPPPRRRGPGDIASASGLDMERIAGLFQEGADVEAVRNAIAEAQAIGVTGVPFFIFAGRLAVPGAQDVAMLRRHRAKPRGHEGHAGGLTLCAAHLLRPGKELAHDGFRGRRD